ncbi:hypothetical protein [Hydrocarboniclastica marina]|uniref:Uncharacterized protein n=1 Tax=Hydrocarboniclastica marina TaxID=2259620 RepID=A0A4P7XEM4_9ALTE|nr:hypothetical protein [Hydrocarboniclastica marina]QCF24844.1 hypothetical protein soil367_02110 [Hydrocarboniclastica marina]
MDRMPYNKGFDNRLHFAVKRTTVKLRLSFKIQVNIQGSTLPIEPSDFAHNEAWLLFQLNEAPVMTEADGDFNAMAIMEVATGMIFGMELVQVRVPGLPEFLSRKLLADAEAQSGSRPQKLFVASEYEADDLIRVAKVMGIAVERVPAKDLSGITQEAREGFAAHVSRVRIQ